MRALRGIWFNVSRLEKRQRLLACDCATPLISSCNDHTESAMAQTMFCHRFAITISLATEINNWLQSTLNFLEQTKTICAFRIISLTLDNTSAEILRCRDPVLLIEVENICEDDATDLRILHDDIIPSPIFFNCTIQILKGGGSVLLTKSSPGKVRRQQ